VITTTKPAPRLGTRAGTAPRTRRQMRTWIIAGAAYLIAVIFLLPYLEMLVMAVRPNSELGLATIFPKHWTFSNFTTLWSGSGLAITRRLGVETRGEDRDAELVTALFAFLMASGAPYEQVFFDWYGGDVSASRAGASPIASSYAGEAFTPLRGAMGAYSSRAGLKLDHRYFGRRQPRTMLIDEMEAVWAPIARDDDWQAFSAILADIAELRTAYS